MRLLPHLAWYPTCSRGKQSIWEKNDTHTTHKARLNPPCLSVASSRPSGDLVPQPWLIQATWLYSFIWFSHIFSRLSKTDWGTFKHTGVHSVPVESHTCGSNTVTFDFINWNRVSGVGGGVCMVGPFQSLRSLSAPDGLPCHLTLPFFTCMQRVKGGTHSTIMWCHKWPPLFENTLSFNFRCDENTCMKKRHREKRC